jgi:hypothetical protein
MQELKPCCLVLETPEEANHSQVRSFLRLMGYSDVGVVNVGLSNLLDHTRDQIVAPNSNSVFIKATQPHLHDLCFVVLSVLIVRKSA